MAGRGWSYNTRKGKAIHRAFSGLNLLAASMSLRSIRFKPENAMNQLTLGTSTIRLHDGLYSLNDPHKAAGGEKKHQPSDFMRLDQTQALIAELNSGDSRSFQTTSGRNGGTYVCRELVYAYANWISPAFYLKMIRFFDAMHPVSLPPTEITKAQAGELAALLAERFPVGKDRPYAWSRFNNHFRLASYKDLPASRFEEATNYIQQMQAKNGEYLPRDEHTSLNQIVAKWVKQIEAGNGTPIEVFEPLVKAVLKKRPSAGHEAMESLILDLLCKQRFSLSFIPLEHGLLKPQIHTHHVNAQTLVPQAVINDVRDRSFNFFPDALIPDLINAIGDRMAGANRSAV